MYKDGEDIHEEVLENLIKALQVRSDAFCLDKLNRKDADKLLRCDDSCYACTTPPMANPIKNS